MRSDENLFLHGNYVICAKRVLACFIPSGRSALNQPLFVEKKLSQIIMFFGLYIVGINQMFSQCGTDLLLRKLFG